MRREPAVNRLPGHLVGEVAEPAAETVETGEEANSEPAAVSGEEEAPADAPAAEAEHGGE